MLIIKLIIEYRLAVVTSVIDMIQARFINLHSFSFDNSVQMSAYELIDKFQLKVRFGSKVNFLQFQPGQVRMCADTLRVCRHILT
jgi:hypothetical protein